RHASNRGDEQRDDRGGFDRPYERLSDVEKSGHRDVDFLRDVEPARRSDRWKRIRHQLQQSSANQQQTERGERGDERRPSEARASFPAQPIEPLRIRGLDRREREKQQTDLHSRESNNNEDLVGDERVPANRGVVREESRFPP